MSGIGLRVVGLDISLTSTGMSDGIRTEVVQTSNAQCMEERMDRIVRGVASFTPATLRQRSADLAVIEGSAFSRKGPGHEELAALRHMVRVKLWRLSIPWAMVPPSTLKLYTTGLGNATKAEMLATVDARHGTGFADVKVKDGRSDRVDAFALAAMGYDHVGQHLQPREGSYDPHRASLEAVKWPSLLSDD